MNRPELEEYNPYFKRYILVVPEGNFEELITNNTTEVIKFFESIPSDKHEYRYAEGKWSVKDILMHMADTERVMGYRALVAARGDSTTVLSNMDEDEYAKNIDVTNRSLKDILEEYVFIRKSTEKLFLNLTEAQSKFRAKTVTHPISARAVGYILIGHAIHHMNTISEKYL